MGKREQLFGTNLCAAYIQTDIEHIGIWEKTQGHWLQTKKPLVPDSELKTESSLAVASSRLLSSIVQPIEDSFLYILSGQYIANDRSFVKTRWVR